ncbi:MAG: hypothetical protein NC080_07425 [Paraprevotella sp.]|nr:hypothetical protein [Paraprevotella sp.]
MDNIEQAIPQDKVFEVLREELANNPRIARLLIRAAEIREIDLYRKTSRAAGIEALTGLTASAHAVMEFCFDITAPPVRSRPDRS